MEKDIFHEDNVKDLYNAKKSGKIFIIAVFTDFTDLIKETSKMYTKGDVNC